MTIETQQGKKSWIGDGSTTNYPYSYPFLNASDIEVYLDGEKQASGFSVQNKTDYSTGANITFDVAPAEGVLIVIRRNIPMTQEISYPENGEFPAKSHEKSLDKLTMLIIDNKKEALKVGPATPEDFDATFPVPEANKALKITADGKGFTMSDYDPDTALALTEDFKNQAQQAAIDALSSQTVATQQANIATEKTAEVVESGIIAIQNIEIAEDEIQELADEIKDNAEDIINRVGISMFDTILKDHVLTYEETKGLALQGTYVYKEALAGLRYGYPDFYAKCLEEYNEALTTETVNGVTVKVHSNGHKFYDIANKLAIDDFFNTMGSAWFYGVDTAEERIFLPRNNFFEQMTGNIAGVGDSIQAGLPNVTGYLDINCGWTYTGASAGSAIYSSNEGPSTLHYSGTNDTGTQDRIKIDASRSSAVYSRSSTVQPNAVKKLLYICVGNTINYKGMTEVVNQGMEILEQVNQGIESRVNQGIESRVNIDGSNLNDEGKNYFAVLCKPSGQYEDLTLLASGSSYTAPGTGYVNLWRICNGPGSFAGLYGTFPSIYSGDANEEFSIFLPVLQGQTFYVFYNDLKTGQPNDAFKFYYDIGASNLL